MTVEYLTICFKVLLRSNIFPDLKPLKPDFASLWLLIIED